MVPLQHLQAAPSESIIAKTSIGGTTELAWSLYQGIIDFNRYFYLQAPSPPWPNSLEFSITQHTFADTFYYWQRAPLPKDRLPRKILPTV
jgi:hypothetical protein